MDDVRVVLENHEVGDPHTGGLRYPTQIVATQIDEHHVLGTLLGIG